MPIQLTTPKDTGDLDPNAAQYAQVKIVHQGIDVSAKIITLRVELGNTVNGAWQPGILPPSNYVIKNRPAVMVGGVETAPASPAYDSLVTQLPGNTTESIYAQSADILYQWLLDNGHYVGTIQ